MFETEFNAGKLRTHDLNTIQVSPSGNQSVSISWALYLSRVDKVSLLKNKLSTIKRIDIYMVKPG